MSLESVVILMLIAYHYGFALNGTQIMRILCAVLELTTCSHTISPMVRTYSTAG